VKIFQIALAAACLTLTATSVHAADAPKAAGSWKIHSSIYGNETDQVCTFAVADKVLTGACKGDQDPIKITGTVDGDKVTWKFDMDYNGMQLTLNYSGIVTADGKLNGDVVVDPMGVNGTFTGVAAAAETK
jgi:hypothetical protein